MSMPIEEWGWRALLTLLIAVIGWLGRNYLSRIEKAQDKQNGSVTKLFEKHEACSSSLPEKYVNINVFDKFVDERHEALEKVADKVDAMANKFNDLKTEIIKSLTWDGKERRQ